MLVHPSVSLFSLTCLHPSHLVNRMMMMQLLQLSSPLRVLPQELLTQTNSKPCSRPLVKSSPTKKLRMYSACLSPRETKPANLPTDIEYYQQLVRRPTRDCD